MKKSFVRFMFALFMMMFLLSGCWNYREINRMSIVAGVAVDRGFHHKYLATLEIVIFKPGQNPDIESKTISGEGDSLLDALRNSYNISGQMGYFNHTRIFIISRDVAQDGILPILDLIHRSPLIRVSLAVTISKMKTAKEILTAQAFNQPLKSFQIGDAFIVQQRAISKALEVEAYQAINAIGGEGTALFLPTVGVKNVNGQLTTELSGTAVFKKDKLVGLLDGNESKYVFFVTNKVRGGIMLEYMDQKAEHATVSLKIKGNQTKITPVMVNGKPVMKIRLKTKADIWEMDSPTNYISEEGQKALKNRAEKALQENIERVIRKVQQNDGADIFGFGNRVRSQMPKAWRKMKPQWDRLFKELKVDVKAEIDIQESGMAMKPLKLGE